MSIKEPNLHALLGNGNGDGDAYGTEKIYGVAPAIVIKLKDDEQNRHMMQAVQVWFPWLHPKDSPNPIFPWARVVSFGAGGADANASGWISTPQLGDEVLCGFEYGDITHPYVLGQLWNGKRSIPEPTPGGTGNPGGAGGQMQGAQGGGAGGAGKGAAGGAGRDAPQGGGADVKGGGAQEQQQAGQGAGQQGAGGGAAGPGGAAGKPQPRFGAVKGGAIKGGALGRIGALQSRPIVGLASARAGMGAARAFLAKLRNMDFGKQIPPPPPPKPKRALELVPIKVHASGVDWLTYHHPILFAELHITGDIGRITVEVTPKRQPVAMLAAWESVAPGNPRAKQLIMGAVGDPCGKSRCWHPANMHRRGWWNQVPGWSSGRISFATGGRKVITIGLYPRYAGTFTLKCSGGGVQSNTVTLRMQNHPRPGD